jgi:GrpB-like predicted nucleotidyltransferase (UPF0157 family)
MSVGVAREEETVSNDGAPAPGHPGRDPIEVVPYDPAWPAAYDRWRDTLAAALGPLAVRIEHIGSTAVPGLPAKPVVDVQVSVRDVDDDAVTAAVESTGLSLGVAEPGHRFFRHRTEAGETRVVHVHVFAAESDDERRHLLFRDYLRAHAEHRDAYASLKDDLARTHRDDRAAYTSAKAGFVAGTMRLAEEWAAATGWDG